MTASSERFLKPTQVAEMVGISRTYVYKLIASEGFPLPVRIGTRSVWVEREVSAWMRKQARKSRALNHERTAAMMAARDQHAAA